ncbi:TetR/AcrR family transcriptional regulator [Pseudooceanicola sp. LIPI14-2-Ac024]|uniref:TetR/AcrR family transcriptional regulator n=1 Tax=Pseudooceanicola sp. LIPI14-2-Ac024 TaxID=3344875 RepID=UPI0035D08769
MGVHETAVRRGRKFDQVLEGARDVFLAEGFEGASVDEIARRAGVSKATLYSYFPDKRLLFFEVAKRECMRVAEDATQLMAEERPVRDMLSIAAQKIVDFFNTDLSLNVFRVCAAESERFPELAREFYESGPGQARAQLMAFLDCASQKGELVVEDIEMAADQFAELCKARILMDRIFGIRGAFTDNELKMIADEAVTTFMARYGKR